MIKELTEYVETNLSTTNITPVIGTNLFAGKRPLDAPDECITIMERVPSIPMPLLSDSFLKPVQVLVRSTDYFSAKAIAEDVHDVIFGRDHAGETLGPLNSGGDIYQMNIATGDGPAYLADDASERSEFSANYLIEGQKNP